MLHMALRNQKWLIRTACVTELGAADCTIVNKAGDSAPALAPGVAAAARLRPPATCAVHFEYVDLGNLMYYVLWAVSIVGLVDLFFSVLGIAWREQDLGRASIGRRSRNTRSRSRRTRQRTTARRGRRRNSAHEQHSLWRDLAIDHAFTADYNVRPSFTFMAYSVLSERASQVNNVVETRRRGHLRRPVVANALKASPLWLCSVASPSAHHNAVEPNAARRRRRRRGGGLHPSQASTNANSDTTKMAAVVAGDNKRVLQSEWRRRHRRPLARFASKYARPPSTASIASSAVARRPSRQT